MWKTFEVSNGAKPQHWINRTFMAPHVEAAQTLHNSNPAGFSFYSRLQINAVQSLLYDISIIMNKQYMVRAEQYIQPRTLTFSILFHRHSCPVDHFEYQCLPCRRIFPCYSCYTNGIQIFPTPIPNANSQWVSNVLQASFSNKRSKNWRIFKMSLDADKGGEMEREFKLRGRGLGKSCSCSRRGIEGPKDPERKTDRSYRWKELPLAAKSDKLSFLSFRKLWKNPQPRPLLTSHELLNGFQIPELLYQQPQSD